MGSCLYSTKEKLVLRTSLQCVSLANNVNIQQNIPLAPMTTLHVGGSARYFIDAQTDTEVKDALDFAAKKKLPLFVLGGGSNLVVADEGWPGLVLKISLRGIEFEYERDNMLFYAGAGEGWDDLVAMTVAKDCAGIECMSGIPGTVGGTPVQNVGAYGQEVSQTIAKVRALDIASGISGEFTNDECGFAYRTSMFNSTQKGKYIVLEVGYRLKQKGEPVLEYADLKKFFADSTGKPCLQDVRNAVRQIRQSKAMLIVPGDEDCRSAGSFFKNPVVNLAEADRVQALAQRLAPSQAMPRFPAQEGQVKLSAAWLVEQSGFAKGYALGPVGISRKHTLAIVNRGGATANDVIVLKDEVQKKVFDVWGVRLHPEPVFVGFDFAGKPLVS
jgi:UDP-N-acetylmuramate dehydrogenase